MTYFIFSVDMRQEKGTQAAEGVNHTKFRDVDVLFLDCLSLGYRNRDWAYGF